MDYCTECHRSLSTILLGRLFIQNKNGNFEHTPYDSCYYCVIITSILTLTQLKVSSSISSIETEYISIFGENSKFVYTKRAMIYKTILQLVKSIMNHSSVYL